VRLDLRSCLLHDVSTARDLLAIANFFVPFKIIFECKKYTNGSTTYLRVFVICCVNMSVLSSCVAEARTWYFDDATLPNL